MNATIKGAHCKRNRIIRPIVFFLLISINAMAQNFSIKGSLPQAKGKEIQLVGYNGLKDTLLSKATSDSNGHFVLQYPKDYTGAALLQVAEMSSLIVLLNNENFQMLWSDVQDFKSLQFENSSENNAFAKGIEINQDAESKLSGLKYLKKIYQKDKPQLAWLTKEISLQETRWDNFLKELPVKGYASYYLNIRKLITDMPLAQVRYPERKAQLEEQFHSMDFNESKLYHSGLLNELIEGYIQLMETYPSIEEIYSHTNAGIDVVLKSLEKNPSLQQDVSAHLFKYLEKRSLFVCAEHLALAMLNQDGCVLDHKKANMFEQYRKMAVGKKAPDVAIGNSSMYALKNKHKLVIFGSSWCPSCQEEYPKLTTNYIALKAIYDLEMVYVALDTEKSDKESFFKDAPFSVVCDYKGWETQAVSDYHVFGTPTMFLLDADNSIILKPNSTEHLEAWMRTNRQKQVN